MKTKLATLTDLINSRTSEYNSELEIRIVLLTNDIDKEADGYYYSLGL